MGVGSLIIFLLIGAAAGFFAGKIMQGSGFGFWGNMGIGVVGSFLGGFIFSLLSISAGGLIGSIVMATVGAVALLYVLKFVKK